MTELTQEVLKRRFSYNPETGIFVWLDGQRIGHVAGAKDRKGYLLVKIMTTTYKLHRLAFLYMIGRWPVGQVDHIDLVKSNNAWINLREATNGENMQNRNRQRNNTSGFKGVTFKKRNRQWCAQIGVEGRRKHIGLFPSAEAAHAAYCKAAKSIHGEFARTE